MCGRFTLTLTPEETARLLALEAALDGEPASPPRWNIAPGQPIAAASQESPDAPRRLRYLDWGLVPRWSRGPGGGARPINARSETVADKPAFRDAWRRRRCLVPADGFYEWQRRGGAKQPWLFRLKDAPGFAMAGIWETWTSPEGLPLHTCALLTTEANALMLPVHDRMPVILRPESFADWLVTPPESAHTLHTLLRPYPADEMTAWPVSPAVNSPHNDAPNLVLSFTPPDSDVQLRLLD
ncbi:MAG: SOS response-associated peptidase [Gemmatimonas sp.]|nr:SOS response-associated peptidase [Gemmatimonas sp.]